MTNMSFIIKCTRECNFACNYCTNRRKSQSYLGFEKLIQLIESSLRCNKEGKTTFIFHGGEPLLLGISYFEKALYLQKMCQSPGQLISNIVQTNGSLIDDKWAAFFKRTGFGVGISLDGPSEIQNRNRRYANGEYTFSDVMNGIKKLQEKELRFGMLSVATNDLLNYDSLTFFNFFMDRDITRLGLLPERPAKKTFKDLKNAKKYYESRRGYSVFMCELYSHWINADNTKFKIRELSSMLDSILGGRPTTCVDNGPCVGKHLGVNVSGAIAHCDKFFDDERFCFGDLESISISEILKSEKFLRAQELENSLRNKCQPCDWFDICKGGCLYDAILFENSGLKNRMDICHVRPIYDFIYKNLLLLTTNESA